MNPNIPALLEKARRALGAAHRNLEAGDAETAANRAYYAGFHAAQAALLSASVSVKTHSGMLDRFRTVFVETGRVPADSASALMRAFQLRQRSDYDATAHLSPEAVATVLSEIERFLTAIGEELA